MSKCKVFFGLTAVVLAACLPASAATDINGGSSWDGWNLVGNSLDLGIWAGGGTTRDYELYSSVFEFNSDPITGSPTQIGIGPSGFNAGTYSTGAFANGNTILGIGLDFAGTASNGGAYFINFDLDGDGFTPASSVGGTNGVYDAFGSAGEAGDFSIWMNGGSNGPSNLGVNTNGAGGVTNLVGGVGSGTSYDYAFRYFTQGNVGGSTQMFFDLTAMQALYGVGGSLVVNPLPGIAGGWSGAPFAIGAFSNNFSVGLYNAEANWSNSSAATFDVNLGAGPSAPVVPVPAAAGLGMLGMSLVGYLRRRKIA